jgi:hypothetical protein
MIDYIKGVSYLPGLGQKLLTSEYLHFEIKVDNDTGEILHHEAEYNNLKFKIFPSVWRVQMSGSIHKYWNNGVHNYNDFNVLDVADVLKDLQNKFGIDPKEMRLENIEFGVNVITPYNPNIFLDNLISFKNHPFDRMRVQGAGKGKVATLSQYILKIYNKTLQYGLINNVLRYEIKVTKMKYLNQGTIYLSDLLNTRFIFGCFTNLISSFKDLIVTERINKKVLSIKHRQKFIELNNPRAWEFMTPKQRYVKRPLFESIIEEFGMQKLKSGLYASVKEKGLELLNYS